MKYTEKPKPCPLCSCTRVTVEQDYGQEWLWIILCGRRVKCGLVLYGGKNETKEQLIKRWGTRS